MSERTSGGARPSSTSTTMFHPRATLTVIASPVGKRRSVAIDPRGTVIGRDTGCDLTVAHEHVSRRHAVIRLRDHRYEVEDLGSANGTTVNGEPIAGPRPLRDGDRLALADVELGFRLGDEPWQAPAPGEGSATPSLRQELHEARGFSGGALLLAVAGSVVGTVLTDAAGTGPWGTLAGAAIGPLVSTTFSTRHAGEKGRVRAAAIGILSVSALFITWAGVSVAETATKQRTTTFPRVFSAPAPPDPVVEVDPVQCGSADVDMAAACPDVTIRYRGGSRVHITGVEVIGRDAGDFIPGSECVGDRLGDGDTCRMTLSFRPSAPAERKATLVIHQDLPAPDRGTRALVTGVGVTGGRPDPDTCVAGFVWRKAADGDHVCVTPAVRAQTAEDNRSADRRQADGACLSGFVRREAVPDDQVCVTPQAHEQAMADNAMAADRRTG
ncbi:FHA domain-containing protein [Actinoplanes palleronii]|uniref:FHA domain-containing protein n=1 Tax=Actinoplanes palleronii TaxID=113570 RepID=A0ABQ4BNN6_9ACTN|nr:FHA domain-containing protein [Actinoplanes palleronii]GIE72273.1 hypothetical protein Apa02nite_083810 [Actinoplanes palleronii]